VEPQSLSKPTLRSNAGIKADEASLQAVIEELTTQNERLQALIVELLMTNQRLRVSDDSI
jgi:hypothetical protein